VKPNKGRIAMLNNLFILFINCNMTAVIMIAQSRNRAIRMSRLVSVLAHPSHSPWQYFKTRSGTLSSTRGTYTIGNDPFKVKEKCFLS
jgi:hypothetical protein